jgi:beta-glucosidase
VATIAGAVTDASPHQHIERAAASGGDTFRLGVDWARAEPVEGAYDEAVFEDYARACDAGRARGVAPVIVLDDGGRPHWLGAGFWLRLESPARFAGWAEAVTERLGDRCHHVVTLVEPNVECWRAWITGARPPYRVGAVGDLVRSLDHVLAAHVAARAAVNRVDPDAKVTLELGARPVYELDGLLVDVLGARAQGVGRYELRPWLTERRRDWYVRRSPPTLIGAVLRRMARSAIPLDQALPRAVAALYR